ncbi:MAG: hypothetical protein SFV15_22910 [Polyangiaceae bacterium]|nr:hypothetical protein [Polyangiaceae bacterium]
MATTALAEAHRAIEALQRLTELFTARRQELAARVGLTEHQWGMLEEVATEHFMPSMFARAQESSPAAVSKTLRQLSDKGLLRVSVNKADGRQRNYVLTAKGKRTMGELRAARERAIAEVWLKLDAAKVVQFAEFGAELGDALEAYQARQQAELAMRGKNGKNALRESV